MWYNWLFLPSDSRMCKNLNKYNNSLEFQMWFTRLFCMIFEMIHIDGLPETCNERYFKMCLLNSGTACLVEKDGVILSLGAAPEGEYNVYGEWKKVLAYGFNTPVDTFELYMPGAGNEDSAEAVLCRANAMQYPPIFQIYRMAEKLADATRTLDTLGRQLKNTRIVLCEESMVKSFVSIMKKMYDNELVTYAGKSIDPDAIKNIPTSIDANLITTAWDNYRNLIDVFCTQWGIGNTNHTDKKERLVVAEVQGNDAYTECNKAILVESLNRFAADANKVFGLDITIRYENGGESNENREDSETERWPDGGRESGGGED